jgi:general secretion pathway protein A
VYESWYGFTEKPFNLTPDPKYLYLSQRHAEAFAHLEFGHRERGGFILITGEVGTGKTTLARYFLSRLPPDTHTAVVLYPALTASELLRTILDDLHVAPDGDSLKSLVDALHRFLLDARARGHNVVLLIDESQDLSTEVLEQIRLISNLETDTEKLIQIVLMGQSELRDLLSRHELRQLAQRVTARYHLSPLGPAETEAYIRHRIAVAGGEGKVGFTTAALQAVHAHSGGVPRLVNLVCDRALLAGYVAGTRSVSAAMVEQSAREVAGERRPRGLRGRHGLTAALLAVGLAALAFALVPRPAQAPADPGSAGLAPVPVATPAAPAPTPAAPPRSERLDAFLRTAPRAESFRAAVGAVETVWGGSDLARTALRTHLEQLRRLDLPVVLEMFHPARRDTCYLALVRLEGRTATVVAAGGETQAPVEQVDELWTREAIFPWPESRELPAEQGARAEWARNSLARLGYADADAGRAVERFQTDAGLVADGLLGPRTRLCLFALSTATRPRLGVEETSR